MKALLTLNNFVPVIQTPVTGLFKALVWADYWNGIMSPPHFPKDSIFYGHRLVFTKRINLFFSSTLSMLEHKAVTSSVKGLIMSVIKKIIRSTAKGLTNWLQSHGLWPEPVKGNFFFTLTGSAYNPDTDHRLYQSVHVSRIKTQI